MTTTKSFHQARSIRTFEQWQCHADGDWEFEWKFKLDDVAFQGHFPQQSLLPGVFLLEMSQRAAEFALLRNGFARPRLLRVDRFRFFQPIMPGDICVLKLDWESSLLNHSIQVGLLFEKHGERVAQGRVTMVCRGAVDEL